MNTLNRSNLLRPALPSVADNLFRQTMIRWLRDLPNGQLIVEDNGEIFEFGQAMSENAPRARVIVNDRRVYREFIRGGSIGAAEAYIEGLWDSPSLVDVIRLFSANIDLLNDLDRQQSLWRRIASRLLHRRNRNTEKRKR